MTQSGVYQIRNTFNEKLYIGSTVNLKTRKHDHFKLLRNNKHKNRYLQNAWNKYGESSFVFEIIEYCDPDQLIIREQWYLDNWNPEYNILPKAYSPLGIKRTEETKQKMRLSHKISIWAKYGFGKHLSKPVLQIDPQTNQVLNKFNSITDASKETGIKKQQISKVCMNSYGYKTAGNYIWRYEG